MIDPPTGADCALHTDSHGRWVRCALLTALAVVALTGCTPNEIRGWIKWHANDPAAAQAHLERPEVQASIAATPAPPSVSSSSSGGRCTGIIDALTRQGVGWDVNRMAAIAHRESRCQPDAANSCCTGLFQIHRIWIPKAGSCGVYSRSDLYDPGKNICTAAIIYRTQGMGAWSTS